MTADKDTLLAGKDRIAHASMAQRNLCDNYRNGCPGDPEPWLVRCNTCDWEFDPEEDGEDCVTAKDAKRLAADHECEPWLEINGPGVGKWVPLNSLNDDSTTHDHPTQHRAADP